VTALYVSDLVREAIDDEWSAFEHRHPHLAACLDRDRLIISAARSLASNPEYQAAMEHATAVGSPATSAAGIVRTFVADFLRRLVG
jgi:hypothetical protein